MVTGTLTPVRVAPQLVPALPAAAPDEHPAIAPRGSSAIVSSAAAGTAGLTSLIFKVTPSGSARACAATLTANPNRTPRHGRAGRGGLTAPEGERRNVVPVGYGAPEKSSEGAWACRRR